MRKYLMIGTFATLVGVVSGLLTVASLAPDNALAVDLQPSLKSAVERVGVGGLGDSEPEEIARVLESLVQILDEEIAERRILEQQVEALQTQLSDLESNLRVRVDEAFGNNRRSGSRQLDSNAVAEQVAQSKVARLAAAGFNEAEVEILQRHQDEFQMQRIEINDQARREGWINKSRYTDELNNLVDTNPIHRELGDERYDKYLLAMRKPNYVTVQSVIGTSPAAQAGLRSGDIITRYGGQRVFSSQQLTGLRSSGERGESVMVEVIRDGQTVEMAMPRGPMGIYTQPIHLDPSLPGGG